MWLFCVCYHIPCRSIILCNLIPSYIIKITIVSTRMQVLPFRVAGQTCPLHLIGFVAGCCAALDLKIATINKSDWTSYTRGLKSFSVNGVCWTISKSFCVAWLIRRRLTLRMSLLSIHITIGPTHSIKYELLKFCNNACCSNATHHALYLYSICIVSLIMFIR